MSVGDEIPSTMDANNELMHALKTLLEIGKYSDLAIVCRDKTYAVHRAIICSRSGFFDGACSAPFKESQTGIIDLSEDDPEAVEHMVHFFYELDYLTSPNANRVSLPSSPIRAAPVSPIFSRSPRKKLNLAFVEDPLLATAAANMGVIQSPLSEDSTSQYTPLHSPLATSHPDYSSKIPPAESLEEDLDSATWDIRSTGSQEADQDNPNLIIHAKVYAIAEKYGISGLKTLARRKFSSQMTHHFTSTEFPAATQEVYESTIDSDRGLRDIVIQTFRSHPELVRRRDVEDIVRDTPGLAWELFRVGWGLPIKG